MRLLLLSFAVLFIVPLEAIAQWGPPQPVVLDSGFARVSTGSFPSQVVDMNGDQRGDQVAINPWVPGIPLTVFWSGSQGAFRAGNTPLPVPAAAVPELTGGTYTRLVNLNGDAFPDIVLYDYNNARVKHLFVNEGNRSIHFLDTIPHTQNVRYTSFVDMDGDGDDELISRTFTGELLAYANTGGAFAATADTLLRHMAPGSISGTADYMIKTLDSAIGPVIWRGDTAGEYRRVGGRYVKVSSAGPSGVNFAAAHWGDNNGDGRLDLYVDIGSIVSAYLYYQDAQGHLATRATVSQDLASQVFGDFNNDGRDEILSVSGTNGSSETLYATSFNGTGGSVSHTVSNVFDGAAYPLAATDMDADGLADYVALQGGNLLYYKNLGNFRFALPASTYAAYDPVVRVLPIQDSQGQAGTLVQTNYSLYFLPQAANPGTGSYLLSAPTSAMMGDTFPNRIDAGSLWDMNHDGVPEFVTGTEKGILVAEIGPGRGRHFANRPLLSTGGFAGQIADIEGQGQPSLLHMLQYGSNFYRSPYLNGQLGAAVAVDVTSSIPNLFSTLAGYNVPARWAFDMDGDHKADLVLPGYQTADIQFYVCKGNGDGTFQPAALLALPQLTGRSTTVEWRDLDSNGLTDALYQINAVAGGQGQKAIAYQMQPGQFRLQILTGSVGNDVWIGVKDVDQDGLPDLVMQNSHFNAAYDHVCQVQLFRGLATGGFSPQPVNSLLPPSPYNGEVRPLGMSDANGDGYPDLLGAFGQYDLSYMINQTAGEALLAGIIYNDLNTNCQADTIEPGLAGWIVRALPGGQEVRTDAAGHYRMLADTNTLSLQVLPAEGQASLVRSLCSNGVIALPALHYGSAISSNLGVRMPICPKLRVTLNYVSPLRICGTGSVVMAVKNEGTAPANGANVVLKRPHGLSITGMDNPYTVIDSTFIRVLLDTVAPGEERYTTISVQAACVGSLANQSLCLQATAGPDSYCPIIPAGGWDGSKLRAETYCQGSTLTINNTGLDMADSSIFQVILQDGRQVTRRFKTVANSTMQFSPGFFGLPDDVPLCLVVKQRPGNPESAYSSSFRAECASPTGGLSTAFVSSMPTDEAVERATLCIPIRSSHDPNDKQVTPAGDSATGHKVPRDARLTYTIRFQNTGSDTAFKVVVQDSLSPFLDPATVLLESSSHPFNLNVQKASEAAGAVLSFTSRPGWVLPYKAADSLRSHGYVSFSVKAKATAPNLTRISNQAFILFDFNTPVRTNTVAVTLADSLFFPTSVKAPVGKGGLSVYPNPATSQLHIGWPAGVEAVAVQVVNAQGQVVQTQPSSPQLSLAALPPGMYQVVVQLQNGKALRASFVRQ